MAARFKTGEMILGGGALVLAAIVGFEAARDLQANSSLFGPALFPTLIALALAAVGLTLLKQALVAESNTAHAPYDLRAVAIISAALLVQMAVLEFAGWIIATTLLFAAAAYAFGNRKYMRDILIGLALAAATFLIFNYLLDLSLPAGAWLP